MMPRAFLCLFLVSSFSPLVQGFHIVADPESPIQKLGSFSISSKCDHNDNKSATSSAILGLSWNRKNVSVKAANTDLHSSDDDMNIKPWLRRGLLLSSFSAGLKPNPQAQNCLMQGLVQALWREQQLWAERRVMTSVLQSPCCGPDLDALDAMETADNALSKFFNKKELNPIEVLWKDQLEALFKVTGTANQLELRFLYIPTAMYALRSDSNNTPGKQRQRARADAKKRRNEIVQLLQELLRNSSSNSALSVDKGGRTRQIPLLAVTLDLDDGSIKQPEGSDDPSHFPSNGKEAIKEWKPHLIYVQGGNTFWLYHCMEKGNWTKDIVEACTGSDAAVYVGTSAGAILMGNSIETACWKGWDDPSVVPDKSTYQDWEGIKGLSLVGGASFFPHMEDQWQALVDKKVMTANQNASNELFSDEYFCMRDEDAICIDGIHNRITVISTKKKII